MKHRANKGPSPGPSPAKSSSSSSGKGNRAGKGQQGGGGGSGGPKASSSSTSSSTSSNAGSPIDLKDIPLSLPVLTVSDHSQWVPRYHAVIRRSDADGVTLEDIDTVQLELEAMLTAAVVRKINLKEEIQVLNNAERYRGSGKNSSRKGPASPGNKRGLSSASGSGSSSSSSSNIRDSAKRFKSSFGKLAEANKIGIVGGLPKIKSDQPVPNFDPLENEQIKPMAEQAKPTLPKNETPNRFWAFVEPYCASITPDDIKLLEDLTKSHNDMSEYFRVPSLGQHYTQRWAKEDLENERLKSAGEAAMGGAERNSSDEGGKMIKKVEIVDEVTPYGELTQRLVGGLMEENIMTSIEESIEASNKRSGGGSGSGGGGEFSEDMVKANLIKSLNINNPEGLEARVRKELEEQGIINADDDDEDDVDNDEILEELRRCQNELRAVSSHNAQQLKRLLQSAREETVRQELRSKLGRADVEVMEAYQKVSSARAKKKPPSKKEREQAWKSLKEREVILKELESV